MNRLKLRLLVVSLECGWKQNSEWKRVVVVQLAECRLPSLRVNEIRFICAASPTAPGSSLEKFGGGSRKISDSVI